MATATNTAGDWAGLAPAYFFRTPNLAVYPTSIPMRVAIQLYAYIFASGSGMSIGQSPASVKA